MDGQVGRRYTRAEEERYIFLLALRHFLMKVLRSSPFLSAALVVQTFILSCWAEATPGDSRSG